MQYGNNQELTRKISLIWSKTYKKEKIFSLNRWILEIISIWNHPNKKLNFALIGFILHFFIFLIALNNKRLCMIHDIKNSLPTVLISLFCKENSRLLNMINFNYRFNLRSWDFVVFKIKPSPLNIEIRKDHNCCCLKFPNHVFSLFNELFIAILFFFLFYDTFDNFLII